MLGFVVVLFPFAPYPLANVVHVLAKGISTNVDGPEAHALLDRDGAARLAPNSLGTSFVLIQIRRSLCDLDRVNDTN